mmetsp:Transcript_88817/g.251790  ORF Transcript_88817/g.251790 Transcript_88817/m.251790 type:complete len:211 (+) Transcript_88817:1528-2160(+)
MPERLLGQLPDPALRRDAHDLPARRAVEEAHLPEALAVPVFIDDLAVLHHLQQALLHDVERVRALRRGGVVEARVRRERQGDDLLGDHLDLVFRELQDVHDRRAFPNSVHDQLHLEGRLLFHPVQAGVLQAPAGRHGLALSGGRRRPVLLALPDHLALPLAPELLVDAYRVELVAGKAEGDHRPVDGGDAVLRADVPVHEGLLPEPASML